MSQDVHRNTFEGGLNTDLSPYLVNSNQYISAKNMSLVDTGKFLSLQNIQGTTNVQRLLTETSYEILGVFATRYTVDTTTDLEGLTIFTYDVAAAGGARTLTIFAYITSTDTLYILHERIVASDYLAANRIIDGVLYPENGVDILYFTDNYHRPMKLRCYIPAGYAPNFLTTEDLDLLRVPALGTIALDATNGITTGGSLLTGTYQLAYQLYNEDSNKYSGFSLLTNPIHIYAAQTTTKWAGIGVASNRKITIDITPTEAEALYYTHFRIAVVENIGATGATVNVGLTPLEPIVLSTGVIQNFEIKSNQQFEFTTIDEIVIDLAAIERVKTLTVKDNRLLLGNIINSELTYDNGEPTVDAVTSTIIEAVTSTSPTNAAENELFMSTKRGYFRDEVYRFAISYFDEYGNYSVPKVLDLEDMIFNQISTDVPDVKFPARSFYSGGDYFTVMDTSNKIRHLGIRLADITNHPTWSKGFVILRAKRKKDILFQTPLVPMAKLSGLGAVGKYPTEYRVGSALTTETNTELEPMGPSSVFVPYNMLFGGPAQSPGLITTSGGATVSKYQAGEVQPLQYMSSAEYVMIFPPQNMYENTAQSFTGGEQFKVADAIVCEANIDRFDSVTLGNPGSKYETSMSVSHFATKDITHYFNDGHTKSTSTLRSTTVPFKNVTAFDNNDEGRLFYGSSIGDYSKVRTAGVEFGSLPFNQRCAVADFNGSILNAALSPPVFAGVSNGDILIAPGKQTSTIGSYANSLIGIESGFSYVNDGIWEVPATTNLGNWDMGTETLLSDSFLKDGVTTPTSGDYYTISAGGGVTYDFDGGGSRTAILLQNGDTIRYDGQKWRTSKDYTTNPFGLKSNLIEISNVIANLDDARYGDVDSYNELIFTGTKHIFTDAEITGNTRPDVTVDVWGGDCVVSAHTFKVCDTTYTIVNNDKLSNGTGDALASLGAQWEKVWLDSTDAAGLCMPIFFKNAANYLTVILESEYNGTIVDHNDGDVSYTDTASDVNVIGAPTEIKTRFPRPYSYNINLNKENDQRLFVPVDELTDTITKFPARILYSDIKIYQTDIDGFDSVRISNIYDLPETYGGITKIAVVGDRLYAVQRNGVASIPMGERVIETTDSSQLAVRSGEVFSQPLYIDTLRGSQHLGSFVNTGNVLYFADNLNKAIYALSGNGLDIISGSGLSSELRTALDSSISERLLLGIYDIVRDKYWIGHKSGTFCYIWNQGLKRWESDMELPSGFLGGAAFTANRLYIVGKDTSDSNYPGIHTMYTGNYGYFGGTYAEPYVKFVPNPSIDFSKVFDAVSINSVIAPSETLITTTHNGATQSTSVSTYRSRDERNWMAKILRDTNGSVNATGEFIERIRGPYCTIELTFPAGVAYTNPITLSSVLTKYRPSFNIF